MPNQPSGDRTVASDAAADATDTDSDADTANTDTATANIDTANTDTANTDTANTDTDTANTDTAAVAVADTADTTDAPAGGARRSSGPGRSRVQTFRDLHQELLLLTNVWDAASARLFERAGAPALATTSSAISWSHGYPDGNRLPPDLALAAVQRIVEAVRVPVSADVESGYADTPAGVAASVRRFADAGAAGVNVEDAVDGTLLSVEVAAERVAAAAQAGIFVNARIDVFLLGGTGRQAVEETLQRATAFARAGADGIFVPGLLDLDVLATVTAGIDLPVNVLAGPGSPTVGELRSAGVRRISVGNDVAAVGYGAAVRAAQQIRQSGTFDALSGGVDYADMQQIWHPDAP